MGLGGGCKARTVRHVGINAFERAMFGVDLNTCAPIVKLDLPVSLARCHHRPSVVEFRVDRPPFPQT